MARRRIAALAALTLSWACSAEPRPPAEVASVPAGPVTGRFALDGDLAEWQDLPQASLGAWRGWVSQVDSGLVLAGPLEPDGSIDLTLSHADPLELPPVGWGHQFGYEELASEAGCATSEFSGNRTAREREACSRWYQRQLAWRDTVRILFTRRWHITQDEVRETLARPVFDALSVRSRVALEPLEPHGKPVARVRGSTFEAVIPWDALPLMPSLVLNRVRVGVGRASIVHPLPTPRRFAVTACDYALRDSLIVTTGRDRDYLEPSPRATAFVRPTANGNIESVVLLDNSAAGYQYEPGDDTRSPVALTAHFWTYRLDPERLLCGPRLAFARTGFIARSPEVIDQPHHVRIHKLANGDFLLRNGPRAWSSYYGSGQCGACPRVGVDVFYLDVATGAITPAFSHVGVAEPGSNEVDITMTDDWKTIAVFEGSSRWKVTRHCLDVARRTYLACGEEDDVAPPSPRGVDIDAIYPSND